MTSYVLEEWFWAMFEPTWTWPNEIFGHLFMWANWPDMGLDGWIMTRYDFLWPDMLDEGDSEQCSNRLLNFALT